jgi:hypothetical protein
MTSSTVCGKVWTIVGVKADSGKAPNGGVRHPSGRRKAKRIGDRETALRVASRIRERMARGDLRLGDASDSDTLEIHARAWLNGLSGNLKVSTIAFYVV